MDKKQPNKPGRFSAAEQEQLALLQRLGTFDPNMLAYGMPGCFDPAQLLNPLVNAQYPMMNPVALQGFSGLGHGSNPSTSGGADWLALMQNQALAAGLGAGYLPGMFPGYLPAVELPKQEQTSSSSGTLKNRDDSKRAHDRLSPRSESRSPSVSRIQQERKSSHESHSSKDRPESRHSMNSPQRPTNSKHHDSKSAIPSWMNNNRKMNEHAFQMELLRQFEQQIVLQQLQIQQQQQHQQQFNATLESMMSIQEKPNMSSRKDVETQKAQEQLNAMMGQFMQSGGMHGVSPAMSALLSQPGALETVLAMSQMGGNMNALPGFQGKSRQEKEHNRDQPSTSSSHNNMSHSTSGSHSSHKHSSPVPSSVTKMHESSNSPRTSQHGDRAPKVQGVSIPGLSPALTAGLSPDNAVLAMMYSQQLQYEEYLKNQMATTSKRNDHVESKASDHEVAHFSKKHFFNESSPRYNQSSHQHNAANTSLTKEKATNSPRHKMSTSPSRKSREQDGDTQKASTSNSFTFKQPAPSKLYEQESMSDTLKLLSTLASNPNLTQQEVATLLSIPPNVDPSTLLATLGPAAAALIQPPSNNRQVTPADLENLNKNLADALDVEKKKFQEHMRAHIEREMEKSVNHISVIHKNKFKTPNQSEEPSTSNTSENICNVVKSSIDGVTDIPRHSAQGDAVSSDGDGKSEMSAPDKQMGVFHTRYTRPRIPVNEEVLAPLKHGWKREIRFKPFGGQLRGEVVYTTPDKRKLRMYSDVMKYLDDNNIKDLSRSNFSFSTRLRLGSLFERKDGKDGNREWVEISEEDLEQSHLNDRGATSSPFADGSDRMSTYSSSSKGDSKHNSKEKEQDKEKFRILKEQEDLRLEQHRMEREIRERLALEEIERQRIAEDQRRQHLILMRALESRKRAEERERRREELRIEKMLQREKKMEQRRIAMQIARELKMPVEDMSAIGAPALPSITRLQGTYDNRCQHQLSGNACADLLMVLEFVKTFKECLRIDVGAILTFKQLQLGLLSDPTHTHALVRLTIALLHQCLCDPGVPAPGPWLHCLTGVKVTDIDVSEDNYSEILRLFIWARSGFKTEISVKLETLSFLSLSADEKATSLAFLVNELVCSRPICMEIEKNLDTIATLKRDKWIVEGQMRQLRIAYEKNPATDGISVDDDSSSAMSVKSSANVDEMGDAVEENAEAVFQKKMEELTQQHNSYNTQLASNAKPLRALDLGQDRFKRRYWVLPHLGGVYVEGLESGISYEDDDESPDEEEDDDDEEEESVDKDSDSEESVDENKKDSNVDDGTSLPKPEPMEVDKNSKIPQTTDDFMNDTKSLDDPTASSKDIAKVLMMLSQEPVNHDMKNCRHTGFEKGHSGDDTENSHQAEQENCTIVNADPSQDALDAITALNNMKANCETKEDVSGVSKLNNSFSDGAGHKSDETKQNSCETPNRNCDKNCSESGLKNSEDSVIAAAKAIAAKAVASTSHLLFPKNESPPKLKPKKEIRSEKNEDQKPHNPNAANNSTLPIGQHTINALVQMGLNPASLSSQQLEALSHLNIPMLNPSYDTAGMDQTLKASSIQPDVKTTHKPEVENEVTKKTGAENISQNQNNSVDLSKAPSSDVDANSKSLNVESEVKSLPIKTEATANMGSPFALQESPDPKSSDNKVFIPISFASGNKNDSAVKSEQEQYNQMVYSCPSPSILANYIISSANYGQLPPLDDIKFPIRPPDVKEEPDAIPREHKRGWWRIESESELRNFSEKLHLRGVREKQLHKNITKNFEFCAGSMVDSLKPEHEFALLTKDAIPDDGGVSKDKTAPEKGKKSSRAVSAQEKKVEDIPSRFLSSDSSAFEAEIAVLKQVEELAARCLNMGIVSSQWESEHPKPSITRKDLRHVALAPLRDQLGVEIKFDVLNPIQHDPTSALGAAVQFLASLEHAVCRRYLKPPLVRKGGASEFSSLPSLSESGALDVAAGLRTWRNAVVSSASAAQLALCVRMLDACIAWERSAAHQAPASDELVNSGAKGKKRKSDKKTVAKYSPAPDGPHAPKKKRKKKTIPIKITVSPKSKKARRMPIDTADVISKSQVPEAPYTNGDVDLKNHETDISNTEAFEASYNSTTDKSSSMLVNHVANNVKNGDDSNTIASPTFSHANSDNMSDEYRPNSEPKKKKKKKKLKVVNQDGTTTKKISKPRKRADKEVVVCRNVLRELQSHEDATWFLFPVDCKLVPGYRKIIKKPIDFHTIESRLKRGRYKNKEEFVAEVRLVFDNCQKFNEDDSPIGRAGHNIRSFFENRWIETLKEKFGIENVPEATSENVSTVVMDTNHCRNEDELLEDHNSSYQSAADENIPSALVMDIDET